MDDYTFKNGQKFKAMYLSDGVSITVGEHGFEKILVVMESGQMAGVHWFVVWKDGKLFGKYNGALVETVLFL